MLPFIVFTSQFKAFSRVNQSKLNHVELCPVIICGAPMLFREIFHEMNESEWLLEHSD